MRTPLRSRPWRALLLLAGAASLIVFSSCMDRDPMQSSILGPQFVIWSPADSEPCSATGAANVNGYVDEPAWNDACTVPFVADLTGSRSTTVIARFMDDGDKAYFSAVSNAPFSNPNSVLRIFLQTSTGQIHAIGIAGNTATQWTCSSLTVCGTPELGPPGAAAFRQNYSGGTAYEIGWPLAALGLATGDVVAVRWETIPGGSAQPTLYPAAADDPLQVEISGEGVVDPNDPALPDIVITTQYAATVTIRNPNADPFVDPTAFQCKIAQPNGSGFVARFNDLPEGTQWVGTAGNKKTCNHLIWPPLNPAFEPDYPVPGQQGAVYNEGNSSSLPLTWTNWLTAKGNAIPLEVVGGEGEIREWNIQFQGNGRRATCTANGDGTTVYAIEPGNHPGIPASPNQPPPGLAISYARRTDCSSTGIAGLSQFTTLVFQMRNQDGGESTGLLCSTCSTTTLFQQSNLVGSTLFVDDVGDGSPVDLQTLTGGLVEDANGNPTDVLSLLVTSKGWNTKKKEYQIFFEIIENPGLATQQTIQVTVYRRLDKNGNAIWSYSVNPDHQKNRVSLGSRSFNTNTTEAGVELLVTGATNVQVRVRANLSDASTDNLPNSGYVTLNGNGGSFASPF